MREALVEALPEVRVPWIAQPVLLVSAPKSASAGRPKSYGEDGGGSRGDDRDGLAPLDLAPVERWGDDQDNIGADAATSDSDLAEAASPT